MIWGLKWWQAVCVIAAALAITGALIRAAAWIRARLRQPRLPTADRQAQAPAALSGLSDRQMFRAEGFRDRVAELSELGRLIAAGKRVIWVTGPAQAGKSWLVSRYVRDNGLADEAARFELAASAELQDLLEGLNVFLCRQGCHAFQAACGSPDLTPVNRVGHLVRALGGGRWVILLDSYEQIAGENHIHALVKEMQQSLDASLVIMGSRVLPDWADKAAELPLGPIDEDVGKDIALQAGAPPDSLDALYTAVGGLPGALEIAGALARERGPAAVARDLRGATQEIGERLFGETFDAASEGAKRLWAGLCLLPAPVTRGTAEAICHRDDFAPSWSELVRWKMLDPGEERAELHPLARAVGGARLRGMHAWARACADRISAHYAGFAQKNANQPLLVEAELENILAAAYMAFDHQQWDSLWAIGSALDDSLDRAGRWHAREQLLGLCYEGAKRSGNKRKHAAFSHDYAVALEQRGALDEAERLYQEGLAIKRQVGDRPGEAKSLHQLGIVAQLRGDLGEAERLYQESLAIKRQLGDRPGEATSLHQLGMVAHDRGDLQQAERLYRESLAMVQEVGDRPGEAVTLHQLGMVAELRGDLGEAERLYRESLAMLQEVGDRPREARTLAQLGLLAEAQGDLSLAVERVQQAASMFDAMRLAEKEQAKAHLQRLRRRLGEERE